VPLGQKKPVGVRNFAEEPKRLLSIDEVRKGDWVVGLDTVTEKVDITKIEKLAREISQLTALETAAFTRALARLLGIPHEMFLTPQAVQVTAAPVAAPAAPPPEEKKVEVAPPKPAKTTVNLKLVKMDEGAKYKVLKEIRALKPGMKIDESKKYVENLPQIILEDAKPDEAAKWEEKLKDTGAHLVRE